MATLPLNPGETMKSKLLSHLPHNDAPFFRGLHIAIAVLILSQIINSNLTEREAMGENNIEAFITWFHIISGFTLIFLGIVLLCWMLTQRGVRWYFAWLTIDFKGIKQDLLLLKKRRLPEATQGGIAATIQGLGVVSLLLVAFSGGLWFLTQRMTGVTAEMARIFMHWHKFLTTFVELYFYSHGAMGILHIYLARNK